MNATRRGSKLRRSWHARLAGCTAFALLTAGGLARAAPGDLDASFGSNGVVRYRYDPKELASPEGPVVISGGLIQQTDGRLAFGLAVHWDGFLAVWSRTQTEDFVVLRFNQDGSPDLSFDGDGRTGPDFPGVAGTTAALLQQADGKLVAAGVGLTVRANSSFYGIGLVRYNVDGSPDTSFGKGGLAFFELGSQLAIEEHVVQQLHAIEQADGRIVVAFTISTTGDPGNIALARFNTDGTLDPTFGTHGQVIIDFADAQRGAYRGDYLLGLVQGPGDNITVAGVADSPSGRNFAVMRLGQDGTPDWSFGAGGKTVVSLLDGSGVLWDGTLAVQPDGKTLIAGGVSRTPGSPDTEVAVVRLNTNGGLDATFGSAGVARISETHFAAAQSVALEPSGSTIVGFLAAAPPPNASAWLRDIRVARLTPSGEIDPTYGASGIAIVDAGIGPRPPAAVLNMQLVRQTDGKVGVVYDDLGWTDDTGAVLGNFFHIGHGAARLLASGRHGGLLGLRVGDRIAVTEDAGSIAVPVRRTGGTFGAVTVDYATASDTATSGADFTETSGTLSWADGDVAEKTIVVAIAADNQFEGPESFKLSLSNPTGGTSLATSEIQIRIAGSTPISSNTPNTPQGSAGPSSSNSGGGAIGWELLIALGLLSVARVSRARRSAGAQA